MTHEEQLVNNITLRISNYVKAENLIIVKDIIVGEVQQYIDSKESTHIIVYDQSNEYMMNQFLATKSLEGRTEKTIDRYKFFIVKLIDFYPNKSFKDMTANDLRYFLSVYKNRGNNSDTTMDGIRRIYCSFFNWLDDEEYIKKSPAKKLSRIKHDTKKELPYTDGEIESMMLNASNIRDKLIISLMFSTACRVSELCAINLDDINYTTKTIRLHGKGKKDRIVPLTEKTLFYIKKYMEYRIANNIKSESLFVSSRKPYNRMTCDNVRRIIKKLGEKSNISHAHPHRFRVTRITMLLKRGMKLEDVQVIAGHSDINTTVRYNRTDMSVVESDFRRCG